MPRGVEDRVNLVVTIAYAVAAGATVLLVRHVLRVYPAAPKRMPLRIGPDGRPSRATAGKWVLWLGPAVLIVAVPLLGVLLARTPPRDDQTAIMVLVMVAIAEVAWLVAWSIDRQIEIARKMTVRIAPARMLRATLPVLVTVAITLAIALRPS